jgi:hypothetical protein
MLVEKLLFHLHATDPQGCIKIKYIFVFLVEFRPLADTGIHIKWYVVFKTVQYYKIFKLHYKRVRLVLFDFRITNAAGIPTTYVYFGSYFSRTILEWIWRLTFLVRKFITRAVYTNQFAETQLQLISTIFAPIGRFIFGSMFSPLSGFARRRNVVFKYISWWITEWRLNNNLRELVAHKCKHYYLVEHAFKEVFTSRTGLPEKYPRRTIIFIRKVLMVCVIIDIIWLIVFNIIYITNIYHQLCVRN